MVAQMMAPSEAVVEVTSSQPRSWMIFVIVGLGWALKKNAEKFLVDWTSKNFKPVLLTSALLWLFLSFHLEELKGTQNEYIQTLLALLSECGLISMEKQDRSSLLLGLMALVKSALNHFFDFFYSMVPLLLITALIAHPFIWKANQVMIGYFCD